MIKVFQEVVGQLPSLSTAEGTRIILGGNSNMPFDRYLEAIGDNPKIKKDRFIQLKKLNNLLIFGELETHNSDHLRK